MSKLIRAAAIAALALCAGAAIAQDYPTNAVWRLDAIAGLPAAVRAGTAPRSLKRLAEGLGAVRLDYRPLMDSDPFRNANTPQALAAIAATLKARVPLPARRPSPRR